MGFFLLLLGAKTVPRAWNPAALKAGMLSPLQGHFQEESLDVKNNASNPSSDGEERRRIWK
jgi:hypothetical protein